MDNEYTHPVAAKLDRWGDRLNAVLVKEVRQALRNKRFIGGFMLALVAALLVTLGTLTAAYDYHGNLRAQAGKGIFYGIYVCLAIVSTVLVPFEAYSRFAADRAQASDDLIQITSLSAWRILLGKLQAAGVTLLLYLSAMVPFSTFAYLLRGVTPMMIVIGLLMTAIAGFTAINLVLFLVTLLPKKQGEALAMLGCIGVTIYLAAGGIYIMEGIERSGVMPRELWIAIGLTTLGFIPFNAIIFSCTAARVSFASANKETIPRLSLLAMNLFIVATGLVLWSETGEEEVPVAVAIAGLAWWGFAGFFLLAVPDEMSQRVRGTFPRLGGIGHFLWPGRGRAYTFYLANIALLCLPALLAVWDAGAGYMDDEVVMAFAFTVFYASFFPALPAATFAWTKKRWHWPQNLLKSTFLFLIIYFAVQILIEGFSAAYFSYRDYSSGMLSPVHALNPIMAVVFAVENRTSDEQTVWNLIVGGLMAAFVLRSFLPVMGRSVTESFRLSRDRRRFKKWGDRAQDGAVDEAARTVADGLQKDGIAISGKELTGLFGPVGEIVDGIVAQDRLDSLVESIGKVQGHALGMIENMGIGRLEIRGETIGTLSQVIDVSRSQLPAVEDAAKRFGHMMGAVYGGCIVAAHGGEWFIDRDAREAGIRLGEATVYPFRQAMEHVEKGSEHSIASRYAALKEKLA